jgi:hypothetical protein
LIRKRNYMDPRTSILHFNGASWTNPETVEGYFYALWGNAADDIWAVGSKFYHYDGTSWSPHSFEEGQQLRAIWGVSPGDIWSVGDGGRMHHHDGTSWSEMSECVAPGIIQAVWASSEADVWAGGHWDDGSILHRNANGWSMVDSDSMLGANGIWGSGPDDVWIVYGGNDIVFRWDGTNLLQVETGVRQPYFDVFGFGPNDVWLVGSDRIVHYDGVSWSVINNDGRPGFTCIWGSAPDDVWVTDYRLVEHWDGVDWTSYYVDELRGIWGSGRNDVWGVGQRDVRCSDHYGYCETEATIYHWDGIAWERHHFVGQEEAILYDVWGTSANDVWAVGFREWPEKGLLVHWDGHGWSEVDSGSMHPLHAIHGTPDGQMWIVGDKGTILRYPP